MKHSILIIICFIFFICPSQSQSVEDTIEVMVVDTIIYLKREFVSDIQTLDYALHKGNLYRIYHDYTMDFDVVHFSKNSKIINIKTKFEHIFSNSQPVGSILRKMGKLKKKKLFVENDKGEMKLVGSYQICEALVFFSVYHSDSGISYGIKTQHTEAGVMIYTFLNILPSKNIPKKMSEYFDEKFKKWAIK